MEYIYGKNVIKETLNSKRKMSKILVSKDFDDRFLMDLIKKEGIEVNFVERRKLDEMFKGNHQGIGAMVEDYQYYTLDKLLNNSKNNPPFLIILDHLEDPHNLGAIIRTCDAASVDGIIIPKDRSVEVNSTVMKVSAGALNYVPICKVTNLNETIKTLKDNGYWIVGTDMEESIPYTEMDYNFPLALVIGSEGNGMSRLVKEACDYYINIPMKGQINSLNASVAAGVVIYEVIRQRGK